MSTVRLSGNCDQHNHHHAITLKKKKKEAGLVSASTVVLLFFVAETTFYCRADFESEGPCSPLVCVSCVFECVLRPAPSSYCPPVGGSLKLLV